MPIHKIRKPRHLGAGVTAIALASVAVALLPGAAAAQVTPVHSNFRVTERVTQFAECTNETIELNTTFSGTATAFIQPSGQNWFTAHLFVTGKGEGSLGNHYTYSLTHNTNLMDAPDIAPEVFTQTFDVRLIGQGDAADIFLHAREHITVNANGELTARISDFSLECR